MTADVVDLASRRPEDEVWRCNCGSISFMLCRDGRIECCGCHEVQNTGNARWVIPDPSMATVVKFKLKPCVDNS